MSKSYRHLTRDERSQIYAHKSNGLSNKRIAEDIVVHRRTIDRETKPNSCKRGYRFQQTDAMAAARSKTASSTPGKLVPSLWENIMKHLREGWSPEQINGRLTFEGLVGIGRS